MSQHFVTGLKSKLKSDFKNRLNVEELFKDTPKQQHLHPKEAEKPVFHVVRTVADQLKWR
jgi:hypothetical protein